MRCLRGQIDLEAIVCWLALTAIAMVVTIYGPQLHARLLWTAFALSLLDAAAIAYRDFHGAAARGL